MAKQLDGRWCDPKNINTFMDMFDQLEAYKNEHGDITLENNPLAEAQMEWLNEFLADFMIDVKVFMETATKIMTDVFTAMADAFRNVADSLSRAQKDGRTRAYGLPAVRFQAPDLPTPLLGDRIGNNGVPFAMPGVNVHSEGFAASINRQLDEMTENRQQQMAVRRRRYES